MTRHATGKDAQPSLLPPGLSQHSAVLREGIEEYQFYVYRSFATLFSTLMFFYEIGWGPVVEEVRLRLSTQP